MTINELVAICAQQHRAIGRDVDHLKLMVSDGMSSQSVLQQIYKVQSLLTAHLVTEEQLIDTLGTKFPLGAEHKENHKLFADRTKILCDEIKHNYNKLALLEALINFRSHLQKHQAGDDQILFDVAKKEIEAGN
jgi:hemerythrin